MKTLFIPALFTLLFAAVTAPSAFAQVPAPAKPEVHNLLDKRIYTYVEQMPQLPGGGGNRAIVEAIQSRLVYPAEALKKQLEAVFL